MEWKGQPVPRVLAVWFDALMAEDIRKGVELWQATRYIDGRLTWKPTDGGGLARPVAIESTGELRRA